MPDIPCDFCGLAPRGAPAAWYITTPRPSSDLTASRFTCDAHLHCGCRVVGHGGAAVQVERLGGGR